MRKRLNSKCFSRRTLLGACTESPRKWLNTAGAYLVQAPEGHLEQEMLGEVRAVPTAYSPIA